MSFLCCGEKIIFGIAAFSNFNVQIAGADEDIVVYVNSIWLCCGGSIWCIFSVYKITINRITYSFALQNLVYFIYDNRVQ